jgi:hypothetical protein
MQMTQAYNLERLHEVIMAVSQEEGSLGVKTATMALLNLLPLKLPMHPLFAQVQLSPKLRGAEPPTLDRHPNQKWTKPTMMMEH